jgi:ferredoxin
MYRCGAHRSEGLESHVELELELEHVWTFHREVREVGVVLACIGRCGACLYRCEVGVVRRMARRE